MDLKLKRLGQNLICEWKLEINVAVISKQWFKLAVLIFWWWAYGVWGSLQIFVVWRKSGAMDIFKISVKKDLNRKFSGSWAMWEV
jgi:hypothetical protein